MTTLISMIGTGKVVENEQNRQLKGYDKIDYSFDTGKTVFTSCSTNAILKSSLYSIDKVVVIGTMTSAWGELLEEPSTEEEELFLRLLDDFEQKRDFDVKSEVAYELAALLRKRWSVQSVSFVAHDDALTLKTGSDIYEQYVDKCLKSEKDLILDITHAFRWMPMFLFSALWYKQAVAHGLGNLRILYGEIRGKTGIIRQLDALWKGQKIAEAMSLFFDKFDADGLVGHIPHACSRLKNALVDFGDSMQADFLMPLVWDREDVLGGDYPLGITVKQLRNGISEVNKLEQCPVWLDWVVGEMYRWVENLRKCRYPSERLLVLADMYAERRLWGQAVMALDVALRIFACEYYQPNIYPDWDMIGKNLETLKNCLARYENNDFHSIGKITVENIHNLMHTRNMIAHGTLNSVHDVSKTQVKPNLSKQYPMYKAALVSLFSCRK